MEDFIATTYKLNGNSFSRVTNTTFPPGMAKEIHILRNDIPMVVDASAFHSISSSLVVLKLQNVDFEFDKVFEPLVGLETLNSLEIGNTRRSRNLTVPFLDKETMNRLIRLEVVNSGVVNVQPEALDSEFRRLRHLSFNHNKLHFIPDGIKSVLNRPKLQSLDLSHNLLGTLVQEWFPPGCTLSYLDLAYNNITFVHLRALDKCQQLRRLVLKGNSGLLYISPSVFLSNCHIEPRMDIDVQHSGIRNVEFALRSCVKAVFYSNTSVPCTCRYMSFIRCQAAKGLIGGCTRRNGQYLPNSDAINENSCDLDERYTPQPMPEAGDSLASLKDWGDCQIFDTTTFSSNPSIITSSTTIPTEASILADTADSTYTLYTSSSIAIPNLTVISAVETPDITFPSAAITTSTDSSSATSATSTFTVPNTFPSISVFISTDSTTVQPQTGSASNYTTETTTTLSPTVSVQMSGPNANNRDTFLPSKETKIPVATSSVSSSASISFAAEKLSSADSLNANFSEWEIETNAPLDWATTKNESSESSLDSKDRMAETNLAVNPLSSGEIEQVEPENQVSHSGSPWTRGNSLLWTTCVALGTKLLPQLMVASG